MVRKKIICCLKIPGFVIINTAGISPDKFYEIFALDASTKAATKCPMFANMTQFVG